MATSLRLLRRFFVLGLVLALARCQCGAPDHPERTDSAGRSELELAQRDFSRAVSLRLEGKWAAAEEALRSALLHDPGNSRLLRELGRTLLRLDRAAEAREVLREARARNPEGILGLEELSECSRRLEDMDDAVAVLRELLEIDPFHDRSLYRLHALYLLAGRAGDGLEFFGQVVSEQRPDWPFGHEATGDFLLRRGDPTAALRRYARCVELGGGSPMLERKVELARSRSASRPGPAESPREGELHAPHAVDPVDPGLGVPAATSSARDS